MRVELKEKERLELSELYLKRYAMIKDAETLQNQLTELQRKLMEINREIQTKQDALLKNKKIQASNIQPVFEDYRLIALEVQEKGGEED